MKLFLRMIVRSSKFSYAQRSYSSLNKSLALSSALGLLAAACGTPCLAAEAKNGPPNVCESALKTNKNFGLPLLATTEPMAPLSPMASRLDTDFLVQNLHSLDLEAHTQFHNRQSELGRVELQLIPLNQELALLRLILGSALNGEVHYQWRVGKSSVARKYGADQFIPASQIRNMLADSKEEFLKFLGEARVTDFTLDRDGSRQLWSLSSASNGGSPQNVNSQISEMHSSEFSRWILELYKVSQASP